MLQVSRLHSKPRGVQGVGVALETKGLGLEGWRPGVMQMMQMLYTHILFCFQNTHTHIYIYIYIHTYMYRYQILWDLGFGMFEGSGDVETGLCSSEWSSPKPQASKLESY